MPFDFRSEKTSDSLARNSVVELLAAMLGLPADRLLTDIPFAELGLDSLDVVEVGIAIDDEFDVDFQAKVSGKHLPKNLSEIMKILQLCLAEKAGA